MKMQSPYFVIEIDAAFGKRALWAGIGSIVTSLPQYAWKRKDRKQAENQAFNSGLKFYHASVKEVA